MVMSTKKIVRGVDKSLNEAVSEINASTPKPDMKDDGAELKAAVAPKKAMSFAEAFKAARAEKGAGKTFTWGGKSFSTNMAGEGAKRSAPARRSEAPKASTGVSESTKKFISRLPLKPKAEAPATPKAEPKRDNTAAGRRERMGKFLSSLNPYNQADAKGKSTRPLLLTGEAAREANRRQGTIGGMRKGGSIDGCAVRGKTRAMKKGK